MAPSSARTFNMIDFAQRAGWKHRIAHQCRDGRASDTKRLSDEAEQRKLPLAAGETGNEDALVF